MAETAAPFRAPRDRAPRIQSLRASGCRSTRPLRSTTECHLRNSPLVVRIAGYRLLRSSSATTSLRQVGIVFEVSTVGWPWTGAAATSAVRTAAFAEPSSPAPATDSPAASCTCGSGFGGNAASATSGSTAGATSDGISCDCSTLDLFLDLVLHLLHRVLRRSLGLDLLGTRRQLGHFFGRRHGKRRKIDHQRRRRLGRNRPHRAAASRQRQPRRE